MLTGVLILLAPSAVVFLALVVWVFAYGAHRTRQQDRFHQNHIKIMRDLEKMRLRGHQPEPGSVTWVK